MLGFFDYNPYVNKGNWGYEHRKSCKNATERDGGTPKNGKCQDCGDNCTATSFTLKDELTLGAGTAVTLNGGSSGAYNNFESKASITINGTLNIGEGDPADPVTYSLVTKDTIILGLSALKNINANAKVTLKGLPLLPITIAPSTAGDGITANLTDVTFSQTDNSFSSLKNSGGLALNLPQNFNSAQITRKDSRPLTTTDHLTKDTILKLTGNSSSGTTITIANIEVTSQGKSLGSTTYTLKGGITGTLEDLNDGGGGVTGNLKITKISYDSYEIHDKHKKDLCCYYGKVYKWTQYASTHVPKSASGQEVCDEGKEAKNLVHAWIWHIFDILLVIKIGLAIILYIHFATENYIATYEVVLLPIQLAGGINVQLKYNSSNLTDTTINGVTINPINIS